MFSLVWWLVCCLWKRIFWRDPLTCRTPTQPPFSATRRELSDSWDSVGKSFHESGLVDSIMLLLFTVYVVLHGRLGSTSVSWRADFISLPFLNFDFLMHTWYPCCEFFIPRWKNEKIWKRRNVFFMGLLIYLGLFFLFYLALGASIFSAIESPIEQTVKDQLLNRKNEFLKKFPCLTGRVHRLPCY